MLLSIPRRKVRTQPLHSCSSLWVNHLPNSTRDASPTYFLPVALFINPSAIRNRHFSPGTINSWTNSRGFGATSLREFFLPATLIYQRPAKGKGEPWNFGGAGISRAPKIQLSRITLRETKNLWTSNQNENHKSKDLAFAQSNSYRRHRIVRYNFSAKVSSWIQMSRGEMKQKENWRAWMYLISGTKVTVDDPRPVCNNLVRLLSPQDRRYGHCPQSLAIGPSSKRGDHYSTRAFGQSVTWASKLPRETSAIYLSLSLCHGHYNATRTDVKQCEFIAPQNHPRSHYCPFTATSGHVMTALFRAKPERSCVVFTGHRLGTLHFVLGQSWLNTKMCLYFLDLWTELLKYLLRKNLFRVAQNLFH